MKRKSILFVSGILFLLLLAWLSLNLLNNKGKSDLELIEFSIEDTTNITKIIITDPSSLSISLENKNGLVFNFK